MLGEVIVVMDITQQLVVPGRDARAAKHVANDHTPAFFDQRAPRVIDIGQIGKVELGHHGLKRLDLLYLLADLRFHPGKTLM